MSAATKSILAVILLTIARISAQPIDAAKYNARTVEETNIQEGRPFISPPLHFPPTTKARSAESGTTADIVVARAVIHPHFGSQSTKPRATESTSAPEHSTPVESRGSVGEIWASHHPNAPHIPCNPNLLSGQYPSTGLRPCPWINAPKLLSAQEEPEKTAGEIWASSHPNAPHVICDPDPNAHPASHLRPCPWVDPPKESAEVDA